MGDDSADPGVIDQHIKSAPMRRRLRDQGFARGFIGKVGLEVSGIHQFASQRIPGLG